MHLTGYGVAFEDAELAREKGFEGSDKTSLLPASLRRRTSVATRTAFAAAERACRMADVEPAQLPAIFTSSVGEIDVTDKLCSDIARNNYPLSPTRFHNSVHNTASGYWSIAVGSGQPAMAMAGYQDGFALGLLEAWCQLQCGADRLLLVCFEERPSELLLPGHGWFGGAAAFVLSGEAGESHAPTLTMPSGAPERGSEPPFAAASPVASALALLGSIRSGETGRVAISPAGDFEWFTELSL